MARPLLVLLLAAAAPLAAGARGPWVPPPGFEAFEFVEALTGHSGEPEAVKPPRKPILYRTVGFAGGASLGSDSAEDDFRNRFGMDRHAPLLLSRWIRFGPGGAREVIGHAYCAARLKLGVGQVVDCFRDADGDGRFDGFLSYAPAKRKETGLAFAPIAPVPFTAWTAGSAPAGALPRGAGDVRVEYEFDAAAGKLVFYLHSVGAFGRADERLDPSIAVDPAGLPATISIGGAQLRLLAWDGKRLTVRLGPVEPATPVMVEPPPPGYAGKRGGYRLTTVALPPR